MIAAEDVAFAAMLGELLPGMLQRRDGLVQLSRETQHHVRRCFAHPQHSCKACRDLRSGGACFRTPAM